VDRERRQGGALATNTDGDLLVDGEDNGKNPREIDLTECGRPIATKVMASWPRSDLGAVHAVYILEYGKRRGRCPGDFVIVPELFDHGKSGLNYVCSVRSFVVSDTPHETYRATFQVLMNLFAHMAMGCMQRERYGQGKCPAPRLRSSSSEAIGRKTTRFSTVN
jgi:hypothetical protein